MARGKDTQVKCSGCGRSVGRSRAAVKYKNVFEKIPGLRSRTSRKEYYCISCAKHRGIPVKKPVIRGRR